MKSDFSCETYLDVCHHTKMFGGLEFVISFVCNLAIPECFEHDWNYH